jgi:hypothetical protein
VRALESFKKPGEHPTLEHLLISLKIFEASFTLGAFASRQLEIAWILQSEIVEAKVCITPVNLVQTFSSQEFALLT